MQTRTGDPASDNQGLMRQSPLQPPFQHVVHRVYVHSNGFKPWAPTSASEDDVRPLLGMGVQRHQRKGEQGVAGRRN